MVEARENTASFEEGSTIWGTWVTDPNDPRLYHAVECNRSSSSSEGPFEVSHCELVSMRLNETFVKLGSLKHTIECSYTELTC